MSRFALGRIESDLSDGSLVASYSNMRPIQNKIVDLTGSGNDGTIYGAPIHSSGLLGDGLRFDGVGDYINCGSGAGILETTNGSFTVESWVKPNLNGSFQQLWSKQGSTSATGTGVGLVRSDGNTWQIYFYDGAGNRYLPGIALSTVGKWEHIVVTFDATATTFKTYYNGEVKTTKTDLVGFTPATAQSFIIGKLSYSDVWYFNGDIPLVAIYNSAKSASWIKKQYEKGARAIQYMTSYGVKETISNQTSGYLSDTPFEIVSGTWSVTSEEIDGKACKVANCVSAGLLALPVSAFYGADSTSAAFGTWEWKHYLTGSSLSASYVMPVASVAAAYNNASQNGYRITWDATGVIYGREIVAGSDSGKFLTAAGAASIGAWNDYKITRVADGAFTFYQNGNIITASAGTNPFTDLTTSSSNYIIIACGSNEKISLGATNGFGYLVKYLGIVKP